MSRIIGIVSISLLIISCTSTTQPIDVQTKGHDKGVKTVSKQAEVIDSKELRYAKSLVERGDRSEAEKIIAGIINTGTNENEITEAMYYQVVWGFTKDARGAFAQLEVNYPDSKYVSRLQKILDEREASKRKLEELKAKWGEGVLLNNDTFILFDTHIVLDTKTALEWIAGPDKATDWYEAKTWVANLTVAGGSWRMPTRKELKTLYKKGVGKHNMTPLLKTTGWWVWSGETKGSMSAWGFSFSSGFEYWYPRGPSFTSRGFAVRSRK